MKKIQKNPEKYKSIKLSAWRGYGRKVESVENGLVRISMNKTYKNKYLMEYIFYLKNGAPVINECGAETTCITPTDDLGPAPTAPDEGLQVWCESRNSLCSLCLSHFYVRDNNSVLFLMSVTRFNNLVQSITYKKIKCFLPTYPPRTRTNKNCSPCDFNGQPAVRDWFNGVPRHACRAIDGYLHSEIEPADVHYFHGVLHKVRYLQHGFYKRGGGLPTYIKYDIHDIVEGTLDPIARHYNHFWQTDYPFDTVPPPGTDSALLKGKGSPLQMVPCTEEHEHGCPVCFGAEDLPFVRLPCKHEGHRKCLDKWFAACPNRNTCKNKKKLSCPVCRVQL